MGLVHHDLCFGCGQANLFGLQMEVEPVENGRGVAGRFFLEAGPPRAAGVAHPGLMATALEEVASLALEAEGISADLESMEVTIESRVPVGSFVALAAVIEERAEGRLVVEVRAELRGAEAGEVARATARFVEA